MQHFKKIGSKIIWPGIAVMVPLIAVKNIIPLMIESVKGRLDIRIVLFRRMRSRAYFERLEIFV